MSEYCREFCDISKCVGMDDGGPHTEEPLVDESLFEYVNKIAGSMPMNHFSRQEVKDKHVQTMLKKLRTSIHQGMADLKASNKASSFCPTQEKRFKDVVYKFGQQSRRMRYWKAFQQVQTEMKRFNSIDLTGFYSRIDDGLFKSQCKYQPTKQAIDFMAAMLIKKMIHLDRLRIHCIRTVNLCIGVIELGHLLNLLLFLVTTLAEVATEASNWNKELKKLYVLLAEHFHHFNDKFPLSAESIPHDSEQEQQSVELNSKEVLLIKALASAPISHSKKIADMYLNELESKSSGVADEAVKHLALIKNLQSQPMLQKVEQSMLVRENREVDVIINRPKKRRRR